MGGKRREPPTGGGDAQGAQPSAKRETLASAAEAQLFSTFSKPVTISVSMRCGPRAMPGEAFEAALRRLVVEFGGRELSVDWSVGPSNDTLQRVVSLVLQHVEPEGRALCREVCKPWRLELEARGVCAKTVPVRPVLAEGDDGGDATRLGRNALRRLLPFVLEHVGPEVVWRTFEGCKVASQEPAASFLPRGAASPEEIPGLRLVQSAGQPQGLHPCLTLKGHWASVTSVAISPDGTRIVSGSRDNLVKIWNAATGAEVRTLTGHSGNILSVAFSPDGKRIASGSSDNLVKIWDAETGAEVWSSTSGVHKGTGSCSCAKQNVGEWDEELFRDSECTLTGHTAAVNSVAFSLDGEWIVSGSDDKLVKLWDARTGEEVRTLTGHWGSVASVAFSPDGTRVVSGSTDELVRIWDAETGAEVHTLSGHTGDMTSVGFSPDGTRVVSGSRDKLVKIWDVETGAEVRTLTGHSGKVLSVAFSPDSKRVVSGSSDNLVKIWNADTGVEVRSTLPGDLSIVNSVNSVTFCPEGKHVVFGSTDNLVKIWDAETEAGVL